MKILNKEDFLKLPKGVLYAKYEPCIFEDIQIKGETLTESDWVFSTLLEVGTLNTLEAMDVALIKGTSFIVDFDSSQRDGCFDDEQLFAVYEKKDVLEMINKISNSLESYPEI